MLPVDLLRLAGIYVARGYCEQFNQNVVGYAPHLIGALRFLALEAITHLASNMRNSILRLRSPARFHCRNLRAGLRLGGAGNCRARVG